MTEDRKNFLVRIAIAVVVILAFAVGFYYVKIRTLETSTQMREKGIVPGKTYTAVNSEPFPDTTSVSLAQGAAVIVPVYSKDSVIETQIVDINFDGYSDVEVALAAGAYNVDTYFYIYNPTTDSFDQYKSFGSGIDYALGFVRFDTEKRQLTSFYKGRGIGDIYVNKTYSFINNTWLLVTVESQDTIEDPYYVKTTESYADNVKTGESKQYYKRDINSGMADFIEVSEQEALSKK